MTDEINPLEAKRLREAFRNTKERVSSEPVAIGDMVGITSSGCGMHDRFLTIYKDGNPIAEIRIDNPTLKRLKREWLYWNDTKSGMLRPYVAHAKLGRGR